MIESKEQLVLYAYCIFCETKRCAIIADLIEKRYSYRCFSPLIIQKKWVKGIEEEVYHECLPGYVFLFSHERVQKLFYFPGMLKWLGNKELADKDLEFAMMLYQHNGIIGNIRLAEIGDRCVINDPAWNGIDGIIVKLDRRKKRCCVEYEFESIKRKVWVGYELINNVDYKLMRE